MIEKFKKKPTKTYEFLIHAGKKYQNSIFKLCKRVIDEEDVPESFRKTTLVMIWKKKGPMSILKNNRFLHMKEVLARTVDALVVAKMKQAIIDSSSIYQVGGLPGHSIHEHLLTLKTVMACKEKKREGFIFLMIDFVSFFDREDIFDCLETMDKINVNKKAKQIWYLLNKGTKIKVKTAHGMTEEEDVGDCLGQGTAGAGLISAANLDIGLQKYFKIDKSDELGKNEEVAMLGKVRIQPIAYQDDIGSICENIDMARSQAKKLSRMTLEKNLNAHPDKSGLIIVGSDKYKAKIERELKEAPIYLTNIKLETKKSDVYLGQSSKSNMSTSALETVKSRAGRIEGAAMEVKTMLEYYEMKAMGGLVAAWELWERTLLPSLLSGAGTWLGNIDAAI